MNTLDVASVWEQSLQLLRNKDETKSSMVQAWLKYLVPLSYDDRQFVLAVRLISAKQWIEERYLPFIMDALAITLEGPREVRIIIDETVEDITTVQSSGHSQSLSQQSSQQILQRSAGSGHVIPIVGQPPLQATQQFPAISSVQGTHASSLLQTAQPQAIPRPITQADSHTSLPDSSANGPGLSSVFAPDPQTQNTPSTDTTTRFIFPNYVMGNSNEFAYKASLRVAEGPGLYFNPLFIYGRSGLGKTHLLLAIKNYISTYLPDKRVVYAPITEFVNDFTNAMAGDRDLTSFKLKYHVCDVLLIDDVQNLEGKEGTTDALFEIFNMFIESKKQIVLSADRSPVEINLDERFTSRFASGITADIQPPNYEMKTAILKNYTRYYCNFLSIPEVEFSDEAVQKIVELSGSNIRELEGAVSNLIVFVSYKPDSQKLMPITYSDVETVLGKSFFHKNTRRVDSDMVIRAVESYFKVSRTELLSEKRSKNISHPRQVAMYLIRRYTDMSYPEIGDSFNKDHTTVMYADKNIQAKMVEEVGVKVEVERIAEMLTL